MAIGRSFAQVKGGVDLSDKMVATTWKGMLVLRGYPVEYNDVRTERQLMVRTSVSTFSGLYNRVLTVKGRAEWEALAKMLGSAYHQEKRMTTNRSGSIISCNPGGVLMGGYDLFIRCNMLAKTSGFTYPRLRSPLITGLPPSPGLLTSLVILPNGEMGILCRLKPPVLTNTPPDEVYRLWMRLYLRGVKMIDRLIGIIKVGSGIPKLEGMKFIEKDKLMPISHQMEQVIAMEKGEETFHTDGILLTGFGVRPKRWGVDWVPFSNLDVGIVQLQAEVVVADTAEHGAVRSAPSNLEVITLPERVGNPDAERLVAIARGENRAKMKKNRLAHNLMKRFFLRAAEKVLAGEMTKDEAVGKAIE